MTQRQLADLAGLSVAVLRDLEQGRVNAPRTATLSRLANALDLSGSDADAFVRNWRGGATTTYDLYLYVLGPLTVNVQGSTVDLGSVRQRLLLGWLALSPNLPVSRDVLIDAVWGSTVPANAVEILQTNMSRLRRRLQPGERTATGTNVLVATSGGYQLNVAEDQLDVLVFRRMVTSARQCREAGTPGAALDSFREALALWRGRPLDGVATLEDHPSVVALNKEWQEAVLEYAEVADELGRHEAVLPLLQRMVAEDQLHEGAHARLMIALAGTGQQAAALALFNDVRNRLVEELGADHGRELAEAHQRVLRQEVDSSEVPESSLASARHQLPPDIGDFTGREAELRFLRGKLPTMDSSTAVVICTIEGMAGVGKTRTAVHLAHQLLAANQFTDQQLYIDLRGYSDQPPVEPTTVLASFLRLLGVASDQIPADVDERSSLYRDRLYGKNVLVLLDNAASEEQIRPLLPAGPTNLVLITSRRTLALDGAHKLPLAEFTAQEAVDFLVRTVGQERVSADPEATHAVIELCGRLPLAIALVARRLEARPSWGFGDLAERLQEAADRVRELASGSRRVRAAFDLSYNALDPETQNVFRLIGMQPGDTITAPVASALAGVTPAAAQWHLEVLVDEHLLIPLSSSRYQLHDLLRTYALELIEQADKQWRMAALERVLVWYLHATKKAGKTVYPHIYDLPPDYPPPEHMPVWADDDEALRWMETEHTNILAAAKMAYSEGFPRIAWQVTIELGAYFDRVGGWDRCMDVAALALRATRQLEDRKGEVAMLNLIGRAYGQMGRIDQCVDVVQAALDICRSIEHTEGEMQSLNNLGIALALRGSRQASIAHFARSRALASELEHNYMVAATTSNIGIVRLQLGEVFEAIRCFKESLEVRRSLNDEVGVATVLHGLGQAHAYLGEYSAALEVLQEGLAIHRRKHSRVQEAEVLETLGDAMYQIGDSESCRQHWQQALEILEDLNHEHAAVLRDRLTSFPGDSSSSG